MVRQIKTTEEFKAVVEQAREQGKTVVVDFYATWCGPCRLMAPFVDRLSQKFSNAVFIKIDVEDDGVEETINTYNVGNLPTFLFMRNGQQVDRVEGSNRTVFEDKVKRYAC